jgi:hypothetical protein
LLKEYNQGQRKWKPNIQCKTTQEHAAHDTVTTRRPYYTAKELNIIIRAATIHAY